MKGASPLLNADAAISKGVEGAEYAHEWVPARNLVMLSVATAYAEANGFNVIALGNNLEESGAYPDNEEQFTIQFDSLLPMAVHDGYEVRVVAPVGTLMKHEIVKLGLELGTPFKETWSCYKGGLKHCGECGPCFMRRTAFERNGTTDPVFEDT
jgi:7-cyano-7-deazaguanine synthase